VSENEITPDLVTAFTKAMHDEEMRAAHNHQKMLQSSIDYVYELRRRNAALQTGETVNTTEKLQRLQNPAVVNKLKDPATLFQKLAFNVDTSKISDENTRLIVGAMIQVGNRLANEVNGGKEEPKPFSIEEAINTLQKVQKHSQEIATQRESQLLNQFVETFKTVRNTQDKGGDWLTEGLEER
jgi:hypothetical protein